MLSPDKVLVAVLKYTLGTRMLWILFSYSHAHLITSILYSRNGIFCILTLLQLLYGWGFFAKAGQLFTYNKYWSLASSVTWIITSVTVLSVFWVCPYKQNESPIWNPNLWRFWDLLHGDLVVAVTTVPDQCQVPQIVWLMSTVHSLSCLPCPSCGALEGAAFCLDHHWCISSDAPSGDV